MDCKPRGPAHLSSPKGTFPVADRAWKVRLWPTPLLISTLRTGASWRILGIGLVATALLALANFLLGQHQARLAESLLESERLTNDVETTSPASQRSGQRR